MWRGVWSSCGWGMTTFTNWRGEAILVGKKRSRQTGRSDGISKNRLNRCSGHNPRVCVCKPVGKICLFIMNRRKQLLILMRWQLTHPGHRIHQRSIPQQTANHFHLTCSCCHVESCLTTLICKDTTFMSNKMLCWVKDPWVWTHVLGGCIWKTDVRLNAVYWMSYVFLTANYKELNKLIVSTYNVTDVRRCSIL